MTWTRSTRWAPGLPDDNLLMQKHAHLSPASSNLPASQLPLPLLTVSHDSAG